MAFLIHLGLWHQGQAIPQCLATLLTLIPLPLLGGPSHPMWMSSLPCPGFDCLSRIPSSSCLCSKLLDGPPCNAEAFLLTLPRSGTLHEEDPCLPGDTLFGLWLSAPGHSCPPAQAWAPTLLIHVLASRLNYWGRKKKEKKSLVIIFNTYRL